MMIEIVKRACDEAGSPTALAKLLGVKPQGLYKWREVPPHHVLAIEAHCSIPRWEQRPDLYPAPPPRKRSL